MKNDIDKMTIILDWVLVAIGKRCKGRDWTPLDGKINGKKKDAKYPIEQRIEGCARACSGISSMFRALGCHAHGCGCACETSASLDGSCELEESNNRHNELFRFVPKGQISMLLYI